jgi:hypothetical protein
MGVLLMADTDDGGSSLNAFCAAFAQPGKRTVRNVKDFLVAAHRTRDALRPAFCIDIRFTGILGLESFEKFIKRHKTGYERNMVWCQLGENHAVFSNFHS